MSVRLRVQISLLLYFNALAGMKVRVRQRKNDVKSVLFQVFAQGLCR